MMPRIDGLTIALAVVGTGLLILIIRLVWMLFHDPGEHARPFRDPLPLAPPPRHPAPPPQTSLAPFPPAVPPGERAPGTAAAAVPAPGLPPLPELHHDAWRYPQRYHYGPPGPAAAGDALPQAAPIPPSPAHHTAVAVGAMIAATHAHLAERERARAAELEAEAAQTRPWADDTGTFTAICAEVT